jgi:23S rRNA (adenine2503-C2)-methyltransferase
MNLNTEDKPDIRDFTEPELKQLMADNGHKSFRGSQIHQWLWQKHVRSYTEMTNVPDDVRLWLSTNFTLHKVEIASKSISSDGTIKVLFSVGENQVVEGVLIPAEDRMTACISSQVGCSLACTFCATGRLKRMRNLSAAEIYDQVVLIKNLAMEYYGKPLTNVVYMGMGEPLLNYANVLRSTYMITNDSGLGMAARRITVSTSGIAKMIRQLADDDVRFNLAISLHSANGAKRSEIMDINDSNPLEVLMDALKYFYQKTRNRITFEYIVFKGFNDTKTDAEELAMYCAKVPCKVNIIEYNAIEAGGFEQAAPEAIDFYQKILSAKGIINTVRRSRGKDIEAACGQLAHKNIPAKIS